MHRRRSNRPRVLIPDSGTTRTTATKIARPTTTDSQNTDDQPNRLNSSPPSGSPSAPPMPSVALIKAMAEETRSFGSSSRMIEMPTGISAAEKPCRARPTISSTKLPALRAAIREPVAISRMQTIIISRLPYMSASRATTGVATAEVSRVAVINQEASSAEIANSSAKLGSSATTRVCCSETVVPARQSTATTAPVARGVRSADRVM